LVVTIFQSELTSLRRALRRYGILFFVNDLKIETPASIGITVYLADGLRGSRLLHAACLVPSGGVPRKGHLSFPRPFGQLLEALNVSLNVFPRAAIKDFRSESFEAKRKLETSVIKEAMLAEITSRLVALPLDTNISVLRHLIDRVPDGLEKLSTAFLVAVASHGWESWEQLGARFPKCDHLAFALFSREALMISNEKNWAMADRAEDAFDLARVFADLDAHQAICLEGKVHCDPTQHTLLKEMSAALVTQRAAMAEYVKSHYASDIRFERRDLSDVRDLRDTGDRLFTVLQLRSRAVKRYRECVAIAYDSSLDDEVTWYEIAELLCSARDCLELGLEMATPFVLGTPILRFSHERFLRCEVIVNEQEINQTRNERSRRHWEIMEIQGSLRSLDKAIDRHERELLSASAWFAGDPTIHRSLALRFMAYQCSMARTHIRSAAELLSGLQSKVFEASRGDVYRLLYNPA
jgi:hypothetical protein